MYEELIKALRTCTNPDKCCEDCGFFDKCYKNTEHFSIEEQAADAIEKLKILADNGEATYEIMVRQTSYIEKLKQKIPHWIPVTERLPEPETDVLSFRIYGSFSQMSEVTMNEMKKNGEWCYEGVTHWMPLPEPPKEET